jgi:hypothetical protein
MRRVRRWFAVALVTLGVGACAAKTTSTEGAASTPCTPMTDPSWTVSYEAVTADGHYVVVAEQASATRVFYGTAERMTEGRVTGTSDSCAHQVDFAVGGAPYVAVFAPTTCNGAVVSKLIVGEGAGTTLPLTVLTGVGPQPAAGMAVSPADLKYVCF